MHTARPRSRTGKKVRPANGHGSPISRDFLSCSTLDRRRFVSAAIQRSPLPRGRPSGLPTSQRRSHARAACAGGTAVSLLQVRGHTHTIGSAKSSTGQTLPDAPLRRLGGFTHPTHSRRRSDQRCARCHHRPQARTWCRSRPGRHRRSTKPTPQCDPRSAERLQGGSSFRP
jgi:hypothetical protein